ncbi:MAG TPA: adenylate/guanylate cyclase domain-containing protein, partial [Candidatus Limnocylindrales bacterium]|nr:adenylate/guanylate cyclase domain-containing protein [Candidatus Limnocylindrales bacterium]
VTAGFVTIAAPLSLPFQAGGTPVSWVLGIGLAGWAIGNLAVLTATRNYPRYVRLLLLSGVPFVPAASSLAGGITGSSNGLTWAFLLPAYAILALGPRRATMWFAIYLAMVAFMVVIDPVARASSPPAAYSVELLGVVENGVVPLVVVFLLLRYTDVRRLAAEARADELLTNAIPASIAARLRRGERRIAEAYPEISIVFADLVGSTSWAHDRPPAEVVDLLDELFTRFDECAEAAGLEKIKTIGDAYMAVAGAPDPQPEHAVAAVEMARTMLGAVDRIRTSTGAPIAVRLGVASGPVVGGVIGRRRLLFDLWGDTVNLASRMESSGIPGRIQIAASTQALLPPGRFPVEAREVDAKGLGRLTTYLLSEPQGDPNA